jgi:molecular chaperone Hsp33
MSLGSEEIRELLIEQGSVKVDCQFCAEKYEFTEDDLTDMLGDQAKTH